MCISLQRVVKGGIDEKNNIGISRFIENKIEHSGKSFHISWAIKRADHGSRKYPLPPSLKWLNTELHRCILC